ncbi:peptidase, U7 family protein [Marinomonas sp. MED121]|uniref:protease SohB n=1 Tax=Marinomonas sp. MED121 TaxID=314277 RepID=UPI00006904AC|nr:protease SohB [Marinomonas sp. MED121]EAQ64757.1 peptidase, U7 family protein [Marinomonas sp. MED121]
MEFLIEYAGFLLKLVTVALIIVLTFAGIFASKGKEKPGGLKITKLNDNYDTAKTQLENELLDKKQLKQQQKEKKKQDKLAAKADKKAKKQASSVIETKKRLFVLDFDGDIQASATQTLRREITAVLSVASADDEVVVRLESGGGVVHGYGLAASQLQRIKDANLPLTICVDKVAASGGYMMACVADKIIAAPFAILGSIGVVAQVPNIHRLLDKSLVDVELHTAGKYKRTLTMLGENTDEGREKFKQDLEDTHVLFKEFVSSARPVIDIEAIATGDVWYGSQALKNNLVDQVSTSDAYLVSHFDSADVVSVRYQEPKKLAEKLGLSVLSALEAKATKWVTKVSQFRGY